MEQFLRAQARLISSAMTSARVQTNPAFTPSPATYLEQLSVENLQKLWMAQSYAADAPAFEALEPHPLLSNAGLLNGPYALFAFDYHQRKVVFASEGTMEVTGYWPKLFLDQYPAAAYELVHPQDRGALLQVELEAFQLFHGQPATTRLHTHYSVSYRILHGQRGEMVWLLSTTFPLYFDAQGSLLYSVSMVTDITPYKQDTRVIGDFTYPDAAGNKHSLRLPSEGKTHTLLTQRELEIVHLLVEGLSSKQMAQVLQISTFTVNNHRKRLLEKTGCKNSTELVKFMAEQGLL